MSFLSCCKLLLLLSLLFELTKAQTRTTNKCLVRWEVNTNEGRTGLKVLGSVSQSGINGDVTSEDFANDHSTSPSDRTSSKTFPVYGAIFSSYVPSSSTDVCNGETFKNMLPTMTALKLENSADGNETTLNMNIPQLYLPASVGLVVNSKVGFVPVKVASSRIIGLSMGVEGTTSTFTKTGANEYSFTTLENTVEMRTKSGTITVHPIVGNPAEVPFAEQKTKRLSMSGTIKYASNEFIMNIKTFEVKLSDTIKIVGNIELRASSRLECNELCTIHGKCVYLSGSTSCQCQCGWSGLDCQVPPTLSSPIYGKAVIPKELPVSGGSMSIIMNGSSANFENILSKSDVRVMIGYSPSVDAPTLLGGSGSAAFAITAPPSYGRLSNVWTNVYLGSTKNWWCHLPQSTSSKIFKYYPTESIYKLYGTCSDQSIPYLGNTLNSVKVYDQIKGGVCGSGIQCLNNGKRESKPCKCNCQDTGGWTGFDCGLCSGKSRIRKSSIDDDINATRSMCSTQVQTEKDKNNVYCDEDMGYRDNYELNLYCMPGPQLVNLTGPDLTVKVLCGAGSAGKCNVDVFFHSSVTYTTGPRRVLFCEAQKCTAKEVSVLIKTDEKGYNVSSVLQQKVVCEEATCACAPGVSECSDTIKSILKEVKGPFQLNCKGSQSLRSFSCTVDEKHLPIQLDLDCSAGTCRTERPPDLLEVESNGFILSPGAIVIIAISLGIAMCFVIACAQVEEGCFGKKQKNEKRNYTCSKIGVVDHVDGNDTVEMIAVTAFSGDDPAHDARNGGNENNSDNSKDGNEEAVVVEGNFKKELFSSVSARRTRNRQSDACMCFNNVCYSVTKQQTSICNVRKEQISPTIILNNVSGSIRQSGLTAIMGESGAGKTSLLRVLQGRATGKQRNVNMNDNENNNILTDIEMPGAGMSSGNFKGPWPEGICPFVAQDKDSEIMESLTVEEQVTFSALLRQPRRIRRRYDNNKNDNEEEHNSPVKIARRVIQVLGLDSVRDSRGGILSGGERRRVSIALEFASLDLRKSKNRTPRLFMLDEPCSGLDSSVAYTITLTLSKLAVEHNIAVAMSIHQPSSALWSCVDDLILMNHGKCLYVGPAHGSLERLKLHFNMSRLKLMYEDKNLSNNDSGISFDDFVQSVYTTTNDAIGDTSTTINHTEDKNCCELSLEVKEGKKNNEDEETKIEFVSDKMTSSLSLGWPDICTDLGVTHASEPDGLLHAAVSPMLLNFQALRVDLLEMNEMKINGEIIVENEEDDVSIDHFSKISWCKSYSILCHRTALNMIRKPGLLRHHFLLALFLALFLGAVFQGVTNDLAGFQNRAGGIFFCLLCFSFMASGAVETFISERRLFSQEIKREYYPHSVLFMVQISCDILFLRIAPSLLFALIFTSLMGLRQGGEQLLIFIVVILLSNITCGVMTMMLSIVHNSSGPATLTSNLIILLSALFGGLVMNINNTPSYLQWVRLLDYFYYAFEALLANELVGMKLSFNPAGVEGIEVKGELFLEALNLRSDAIGEDIGILCLIVFGYGTLAFVALTCCIPEGLTCTRFIRRCKICCFCFFK